MRREQLLNPQHSTLTPQPSPRKPSSGWRDLAALPARLGIAGLRIGIACGGVGPERAVSLDSGRCVFEALSRRAPRCRLLDVDQSRGRRLKSLLAGADVVFVALHGRYGEDGGFQQALDEIGMPYTGSGVEASRLAFDKRLSKRRFGEAGIRTPRAVMLWEPHELEPAAAARSIAGALAVPLVVKPACSGSSLGVSIVRSADALPQAVEAALAASPSDRLGIVAEEYVGGDELTVGVLGGRPLPVIRVRPAREFYDYAAKYHDERTGFEVPAALDAAVAEKAQSAGIAAFQALGCREFGRVDMMLGADGEIYVFEVNTIPGLTSHSLLPKAAAAVGLDFSALTCIMTALALVRCGRA